MIYGILCNWGDTITVTWYESLQDAIDNCHGDDIVIRKVEL